MDGYHNVSDKQILNYLRAFEVLRWLEREVPAQLVSTLLYVASHNPCLKKTLEKDLRLTTSSASRLTDWLSEYHRLGKPGLGLITKSKDPTDYRLVVLKLSPKGEAIIQQMKDYLDGKGNQLGSSS